MATTLYEYYQSQGQNLPSVEQRKSTASQAGISNYTGTAQQNTQLLGYLQGNNIQSQAIPAQVALNNVPPTQLPTQVPSGSSQLTGAARGFLSQPPITSLSQLGSATQIAGQNAETATDQYRQALQGTMEGRQNLQAGLEQEFDIAGKTEAFNLVKNKFDSTELRYRREKEATMTNPMLSEAQKSARVREIERKEATQLADIAIDYSLKTNQLNSAKELLNEKKNFELEGMRMQLDYYKELKNDYQDIFNTTQKATLDNLVRQEERAYENAQRNADRVYDLQLEAIKMGIKDSSIISKIKSPADLAKYALLGTNGVSTLSEEQLGKIASNPTAKQAVARVGVINAVNEYVSKLEAYKGSGGFDWNRLTKSEKRELETALKTTVGSAINVAQGQGAMGAEEGERILNDLLPTRWTRTKVFSSSGKGVVDAQNSLLRTELSFLDSVFPGASNSLTVFSDYLHGNSADSYLDYSLSDTNVYNTYINSLYGQ